MAFGYWKLNMHEREAVFQHVFRKEPFKGNYSVACGLATLIEFLENWHFSDDDLNFLSTLRAPDKSPLFTEDFLNYLKTVRFTGNIDAVQEGDLIFPQVPIWRI